MKGHNLIIFQDAYREMQMPQRNPYSFQKQQPMYVPVKTGLEKLMKHYGVSLGEGIVMDEKCYKQRIRRAFGGGEQEITFAPIIQKENIDHDLDFLKNINGLVMFKTSPVNADEKASGMDKVTVRKLFTSSDKSWIMKGRINYSTMDSGKPSSEDEMKKYTLAVLAQGTFNSYFADRKIPEKPAKKDEKTQSDNVKSKKTENTDASNIRANDVVIKKGKPGKIFLVGTSQILKDNILDENGQSSNSQFVFNVLDAMNGREDIAVMRSKTQTYNPLGETSPGTRAFIKWFNIIALPLLVIGAGLAVWVRRGFRKRMIRQIFAK